MVTTEITTYLKANFYCLLLFAAEYKQTVEDFDWIDVTM